jgi:hypothetical protein
MERPPELLKDFADRLARIAVTEDGEQVTRLLRVAGLLGDPSKATEQSLTDHIGDPVKPDEAPAESPSPLRVGIWEGRQENGEIHFVRRADMNGAKSFWADVERIKPKGARRRVVLVGESVARAYFYDPQFTMAGALEMILQSRLGEGEVEVVDLARTNIGFEVKELAMSALLLEPDAVVIFAGNNWDIPLHPDASEVAAMDTLIRKEGLPGFKRWVEARLVKEVRQLVGEVAALYASKGVPLVWMIPEFNLGDWQDPSTNAPYLPAGVNREWLAHWETARAALRREDFATAAEAAEQMVRLDGGTTVTGLYILAECGARTGAPDAARRFLEQARDALIWDSSRSISPRAYTVAQETLREEVRKQRNEMVDVPELFGEYLNGGLPDRSLFLDYCHLTTKGIQITMAAAASRLLRLFDGIDIPWPALADEKVAPTAEVEAEAAFLAALHNAHWWQPDELVRYHCLRAVRLSPGIARVMNSFIDLQTRRTPMLMCRAAEELAQSGSPLIRQYLLRHSTQQLDRNLLDAVVSSLQELGIEARARLDELRQEEHSVTGRDADLLDYYYVSATLQPQEVMWLFPPQFQKRSRRKHYYTAYSPESRFIFIGNANSPVRLHLTSRLPHPAEPAGATSIEVNGSRVGEVSNGREWGSWDIEVEVGALREGLNEVIIRWPLPAFPGEAPLASLIDDLVDKAEPELFCPFGEIHSFVASDARGR